jgi:alpha-beta hydrolase superfamily lysophospholipase
VVVTAPWMLLGFDPPKFKLMLASVMKNIYPKFAEKADLDTSFISRDKEEVRKYDTDPLIHNTARAGTFFETYNAGKWAMENADKLTLPLLIMHGTADKIISHTGSENFVAHAPLHLVTFKSYEGYYHEIHNEPAADRERVFHDMSHWLDKHLTTATA